MKSNAWQWYLNHISDLTRKHVSVNDRFQSQYVRSAVETQASDRPDNQLLILLLDMCNFFFTAFCLLIKEPMWNDVNIESDHKKIQIPGILVSAIHLTALSIAALYQVMARNADSHISSRAPVWETHLLKVLGKSHMHPSVHKKIGSHIIVDGFW